jgi:hypothetical protein
LFTPLSINPTILQEKHKFQLHQKGSLQIIMPVGNSEENGNNNTSKSKDKCQRSVASLDSIAENDDFISL